MFRSIVIALSVIAVLCLFWMNAQSPPAVVDDGVCAGPRLGSAQARNEALEAGYQINRDRDCIDKASFDAVAAQQQAWTQQREQTVASERKQLATAGATDFAQSRHGFTTAIAIRDPHPLALPQPPAHLFVRSDYKNPQNYMLPGFISPDPGDGRRHPAIIWLTGGDSNSLSDFWTPGAAANDQSAHAFRDAGMIMVLPTLRGGNGHASTKELLLGEVDDVLAAAEQLKRLSYIDPERIYLGGHSTGGTLALLTAAMKTPFKAVFAFGPVASADHYPDTVMPIDFATLDARELRLRSPIHWLASISQPTYVIEGMTGVSNGDELEAICAASSNPLLRCIRVTGADHFSVLSAATPIIAAKLMSADADATSFNPEEFAQ